MWGRARLKCADPWAGSGSGPASARPAYAAGRENGEAHRRDLARIQSTAYRALCRRGVVLVTTDARTFTRVPFPEPVDLAMVTASGPRAASVTTADGRVFETSDAGLTWRRR